MASAVLDANIEVTNVEKNTSNGTIKVTYKVKAKDAGKKGIVIGYEWPSNYQLSDSYSTGVANNVGSHTITIPKQQHLIVIINRFIPIHKFLYGKKRKEAGAEGF